MSQPPAYTRSFSYTGWSADNPTLPQPGVSLDADFSGVSTTLAAVLANLAIIQRDDGRLANGSVSLDTLESTVLLAFGAGGSWIPRGAWLTATAYGVGDVVGNGTATYVAGLAHTSGTFATDLAAGKWIKIYDSAGSTPADGSVTAPKLAAGAVMTPAIGFTALDLAGTVRAAAGLSAGTAPLGAVLHAKLDAGDVVARVERKTDAQGKVGYRWVGPAITWEATVPASGDALSFYRNGTLHTTLESYGINASGAVQAFGAAPTGGDGASISYSGLTGFLRAYNAGTNTWRDLKAQGKTVTVTAAGVDVGTFKTTGLELSPQLPGASGGVPAGAVFHFAMVDAPAGYLKCNGAAVSRATYAGLFAAISTVFGAGDGSTTFNLPDLRGEFLRSLDDGRGVDAARVLGTAQAQQTAAHKHISGWGGSLSVATPSFGTSGTGSGSVSFVNPGQPLFLTSDASDTGVNAAGVIGAETRPRNIALLACIKY